MTDGIGLHLNVPMEEYLATPAVSASDLWMLCSRSPAHMMARRETPHPQTDALSFGTALHMAVLEPHLFRERYATPSPCSALKKDMTPCGNAARVDRGALGAFCGVRGHDPSPDLPGRDIAPQEVLSAERAVRCHPRMRAILSGDGVAEATLIWRDPGTGLPCKARPDWLAFDLKICLDLKTTQNAAPAVLGREIARWGYHLKAAHYLQGLQVLGATVPQLEGMDAFLFAFVESGGPYHGVTLGELAAADLESAWERHREAISFYAECLETDSWTGYSDTVQTITLPAYARHSQED